MSRLDYSKLYQIETVLEDCALHKCSKSCHGRVDTYLYPGELEYLQEHRPDKLSRVTPYLAADGSTRAICHQEGGCDDPLLVCKFAPLLIDTRSGRAEPFHEGFCPVRKIPLSFVMGVLKLVCETYINPLLAEREGAVKAIQHYVEHIHEAMPSDAEDTIHELRRIFGIDCNGQPKEALP